MKYKGKVFEYFTHDGIKRVAVCKEIAFHKGLGKPIFIGVSPFGNVVKLTKEEIHKFI
ncbi:hypothetical protein J36TS2_39390 [Bacillus paralicheniformis]|nr:hypothetical protein CHCC14566_0313 [Bacillus licheniformis]GIN55045.1 hypothetical protein J36TS2_39390 [Bacillus paralicheniformis]